MSVFFGDGRDGNLTVLSGTFNLNTDITGSRSYADGIAYKVTSNPSTKYVSIGTTPNGITVGDKVLLINLQGSISDYADVGNWEIIHVNDINATGVELAEDPTKSYDGISWADQKVILQRVPQYENVTVSGTGIITASLYDRLVTTPTGAAGYYTAIVAMMINGILHNSADITTSGLGYQGAPNVANSQQWGASGESTGDATTSIREYVTNKPDGGAGSAYYPGSGGAGGGHGTAGVNGVPNADTATSAEGGNAFGDAPLYKMNYGGGGGGSGQWYDSRSSWGGGNGGGIIYISARNIYSYGFITAEGEQGTNGVKQVDDNSGGGGGGGGGGAVYIKTHNLYGNGSSITSAGGAGGLRDITANKSRTGSVGGAGLARIDYSIINGTNYPNVIGANSILDPDPYASRLPEGWYYFSGYTKMTNFSVSRTLYCYRRDTGQYMGTTTSSGDGFFTVITTHSGTHFVIALDDVAGANYNDIVIGNITPYYYDPI